MKHPFLFPRSIGKVILFLLLLVINASYLPAQQQIDIGIFGTAQPDQFDIKLRSNYLETLYLTNLQFTIKWPVQGNTTLNYLGLVSPYLLLPQGQFQSGGFNYWVFVSPGGSLLNMSSGVEYLCASFTLDQPACLDIEIADDAWTIANNGAFYIEVNGLPKTGIIYQPVVSYSNAVGQPGNISGNANICQGSQQTYSIASIPNALTYIWSFSGSGVTLSGNGSNVTLSFSSQSTSGYLSVAGSNGCGQGISSQPYYISVTPIPIVGSMITGPSNICANSKNLIYSIPNPNQTVSYYWSTPLGFTINGNTNTNVINIQPGVNALSGPLSLFLMNQCGSSDTITLPILIQPLPIADAGPDTIIQSGSFAYLNAAPTGISLCSFNWLPENMVLQASQQYTQTYPLFNSTVFTLLVTAPTSNCVVKDHKQVALTGGALAILPTVSSSSICKNDSVQLFANACCGSGNYSYSWYSPNLATPVFQSNLPNPWFTPDSSTTAYLIVSDGITSDTAIVQVMVHTPATAYFYSVDTICEQDSLPVLLTFTGIAPFSIILSNNSISLSYSNITQNQLLIYLKDSGQYNATYFTDTECDGVTTGFVHLTTNPIPVPSFLSLVGTTLISNYTMGNQWYNLSGPILGATSQQYQPTSNGTYYNIVTMNGCISPASNLITITTVGFGEFNHKQPGITVFPNPAAEYITIHYPDNLFESRIEIHNVLGVRMTNFTTHYSHQSECRLFIGSLRAGVYFLTLRTRTGLTETIPIVKP